MWRSIQVLVLLPSLSAAQSSEPPLHVVTYRSLGQLRRGTEEKVAVLVEPTPFSTAPGHLTSPRSSVPGIAPVNLEVQTAEGFSFGPIDYPKAYGHKFAFQRKRISVFEFPYQHIEFTLRAAPDATLGRHMLSGKLTLQGVSDSGVSARQELDVLIPVTVVERRANVSPTANWPIQDRIPAWGDMSVASKVVLIPLLPVLFLLSSLVCMARGQDCRC